MLEAVRRAFASGGTLVMDLMDGEWMRDNFEPRSWEWVDQNHFVCRERDAGRRPRPADQPRGRGARRARRHRRPVLCRAALFEGPAGALMDPRRLRQYPFPSGCGAGFARNQDLGMVEHRLFVTGEAPRRPYACRAAPRCFRTSRWCWATRGCPTRSSATASSMQRMPRRWRGSRRPSPNCPATVSAISTTTPTLLRRSARAAAGLRAEFLRRGLQQRRLHGNARAGLLGNARYPV